MNLADLLKAPPVAVPPVAVPPVAVPPVAVPTPSDTDLWRAEQITPRELASLAASLLRHKSDEKQTLGRALLRAIKGELFAGHGSRNLTAYKLSAEIIESYPNCDPDSVMACLSASISRAQIDGSKLTEDTWRAMLERLQDERRGRVNMVKDVSGKLGKALLARASAVGEPMPSGAGWVAAASSSEARNPEPPTPPGAPRTGPDPAALNTLLIKADGLYYLRRPTETIYRWRLDSHESLAIELANQFGTDNSEIITHDATGQSLPMSDLVKVYASNAHRIVHDYSSADTTWEPQAAALHVGLPSVLPAPQIDREVHAWLEELAGDADAVLDLYDWIAASAREYIGRPAAGLVIVGPKDTGKSLLALALAQTWGVLPVKLGNAVERFNGALLGSPFWHADERMPEDLSDAAYREIVQARARLIEPKGREKVELHGCARLIITLNEPEDLRLGGLEGANALEAVVDRIAFFDCTDRAEQVTAALDRLRYRSGPNTHDVDLGRIVRHLRAVQCGYMPRMQRFLGARGDRSAARGLVIRQGITRTAGELIEALIEYVQDPDAWERAYHLEDRPFATGQRYPVITEDGGLWVWPKELAKRLAQSTTGKRDAVLPAIKRALKALRGAGKPREITFGSRALRCEFWPVDLEKLLIAASVPAGAELFGRAVNTCARSTRERKGLAGS